MSDNGAYRSYRSYPEYRDPTPWAAGITVAVFVGLLTAVAVYAFGAALAQVNPVLAVLVNVVAAGGVAPTVWRWSKAPVVRWVLAGAVAGVAVGWVVLVIVGLAAL